MPYWVRTVYAGKCKEVKKYYSRRHKPKEKRIKREEPTRETQENVNIRKQTEQLRWKLNCNFQEGDMFVTFSYKKEERPDTYEDLVKQKNKLIADLRKEYKKQERELKYIYVLETGSKGARHIHMVLESIEPKAIKRCWDRGRIDIRLLDGTGQYGKLAAYLVKEKGRKKMEKYGGKTYSPIKKPETANYQERIDMGKRFLPNGCKEPKRLLYRQKTR